ncbi:hypothetical protein AYI69_g4839 [Smittium culicis]|uniref:Uncharacterized protein n=1 Tax=Smittium culicis TaxID=133412 RepID=A0A1R1YAE7_9FUNG|nr:hypothetical protein AYI69_g4839 [Smittium culicis]
MLLSYADNRRKNERGNSLFSSKLFDELITTATESLSFSRYSYYESPVFRIRLHSHTRNSKTSIKAEILGKAAPLVEPDINSAQTAEAALQIAASNFHSTLSLCRPPPPLGGRLTMFRSEKGTNVEGIWRRTAKYLSRAKSLRSPKVIQARYEDKVGLPTADDKAAVSGATSSEIQEEDRSRYPCCTDGGSHLSIEKEHDRTSEIMKPGILQQLFCNSKEVRGVQISLEPEITESSRLRTEIQVGFTDFDLLPNSQKGFHIFPGSKGCVHAHPGPQNLQKMPPLLFE